MRLTAADSTFDASPTLPAAPAARLDSLTGMRFLASLLVVLHHMLNNALQENIHIAKLPVVDKLASIGFTGVTFFFILSGFVLAWVWQPGSAVGAFLGRRFARVYPMHFVTWLAAFAVVAYVGQSTSLWEALGALFLVQAWSLAPAFPFKHNGVTWSLSNELFFYLSFPWVIARLQWLRQRALLLVVAGCFGFLVLVPAVLRPFSSPDGFRWIVILYYFPPYRIAEFVLGAAAALLVRRGWRPFWSLRTAHVFVAVSLLAVSVVSWRVAIAKSAEGLPRPLIDLLVIPAFVAWIVAAAVSDLERRPGVLASAVLVRLGTWSFALYLTHQLVLRALVELRGPEYWRGVPLNLAVAVAVLALLVAVAGTAYELVERPLERWLRARVGVDRGRATIAPAT